MTEQNVDDKLEAAFTELENETPESSSGGFGSALGIILGLVAIGIASYPAYEMFQNRSTGNEVPLATAAELAQVSSTQSQLRSLTDQQGQQLTAIQSALNERRQQQAAFRNEMEGMLANLNENREVKPRDYAIAEVEYLVRMANQRVLMERDPASALRLLRSADEIVAESEGLTAHLVREALAGDIASLKAVAEVDVQGSYLQLSALISQVPSLQRSLPTYEVPAEQAVAETQAVTFLEKAIALSARAMQRLAELVDFRRDSVEVKPILPPQEVYYLRQNLILKLQIAQMALLDANQAVYSNALTEASAWVAEGFDADDSVTVAIQSSLTELNAQNIAAPLPDISGSLVAVRQVMREAQE